VSSSVISQIRFANEPNTYRSGNESASVARPVVGFE
jgi:hypothetical protein